MNEGLIARMREATQLLKTSGPAAATAAIRRALQGTDEDVATGVAPAPGGSRKGRDPVVIDMETGAAEPEAATPSLRERLRRFSAKARPAAPVRPETPPGRSMESGSVTNAAGTRAYRLYVPANYRGEPLPLVVMLHGCQQNPEDFAAGTTMNALADAENYLVAYPAQAQAANGSNCWNWFRGADQQRGQGEPSIIADIVQKIAGTHAVNQRRIYVAGLSAGGAMAGIVAAAYPELFAAAGIHSGLPCGAAHDLPTALAAMKGSNGKARSTASRATHAARGPGVPTIVFHGDRDTTVHPSNGEQALVQCVQRFPVKLEAVVEKGQVPHGRAYTRTMHRQAGGSIVAEHWVVHGAGHAWSGGSSHGSYTDGKGPSATREMMRFFRTHELKG